MADDHPLAHIDELHGGLAAVQSQLAAATPRREPGEMFIERSDGAIVTRDGRVLREKVVPIKLNTDVP